MDISKHSRRRFRSARIFNMSFCDAQIVRDLYCTFKFFAHRGLSLLRMERHTCDAALKTFLTASPEVRAQRRYKQLIEKGIAANLAALSRDLAERDKRDRDRAVAPLKPAVDSQVLDSSALSIEQVVERIVAWWREKEAKSGGRG